MATKTELGKSEVSLIDSIRTNLLRKLHQILKQVMSGTILNNKPFHFGKKKGFYINLFVTNSHFRIFQTFL